MADNQTYDKLVAKAKDRLLAAGYEEVVADDAAHEVIGAIVHETPTYDSLRLAIMKNWLLNVSDPIMPSEILKVTMDTIWPLIAPYVPAEGTDDT